MVNRFLKYLNRPLFDQVLFDKCMDYIISLSCTPLGVYRQVASLVGLQMVTYRRMDLSTVQSKENMVRMKVRHTWDHVLFDDMLQGLADSSKKLQPTLSSHFDP
nr:sister-chromatid cohesion protein 3 [Tanacetum cinerariifolium]